MKYFFRSVLLAALAILGFWLWTFLFPSPDKVVLAKIARLAANATFSGDDNEIIRVSKASQLAAAFSSEAQIVMEVPGMGAHTFSGRDEIRESAVRGFAGLIALKVKFLDATARVAADKTTAEVNCTAQVNVGNDKDFSLQEMRFQLQKMGDAWFITRAETIKTLR